MRVFVTGGAGYIGSHTILQLLREGHSVLSVDNYINSTKRSIDKVQELTGGDLIVVEGNICNRTLLDDSMARFSPDAVMHFAGLKAVGESNTKPLDYYRNNVAGTVELLDSMQKHGCHRIVFSSSATVYGNAQYLPFDENHPVQPTNPYGRTKAVVEGIIQDWCRSSSQNGSVSLRYFNPVGADDSGQIGENPNGIPNNLVPFIAKVAMGQLEKLHVFGGDYDTRDGTGERDYVHVSDLADAHLAALNYVEKHTGCESVNIGTGTGVTVLEMIKAFEKASGRSIPYAIEARREGDVALSLAATEKAKRVLNWTAKRDLETMCQSVWKWQQYELQENKK